MLWDLIGFVGFGLVVGVVARLIKSGRQDLGLGGTVLLGMAGSVIGGIVAGLIGSGDIFELNIIGAVVAVVAAVALVGTAEAVVGKGERRQLR